MRVVVAALALLACVGARAEPALIVVGQGVSDEQAAAIVAGARAPGVDVAQASEPAPPSTEEVLGEARRLFRDMDFARATLRLSSAEPSLIEGRTPTPALVATLVELETWLGACLLFSRNAVDAGERFALARALDPNARVDPVFPPEVARAFAHSPSPAPITVRFRVTPSPARVWIDGRLADAAPTARPGLHYVVAERADRRPFARIVRIVASAPEIALALGDVASRPQSLQQVARQARRAPLQREEASAVAALQGRALWTVAARDGHLGATRWPADAAETPRTVEIDRAEEAARAICRAEHACADEPPPAVAVTPPAAPVAAATSERATARPVWRRGWFWAVLGVAALLVAGGIAGAVVATAPRDYVARF